MDTFGLGIGSAARPSTETTMAGAKGGEFRQLLSPHLAAKLAELEAREGIAAPAYLAIARQYLKSPLENLIRPESRRRYYESEVECSRA